MIYKNKNVLILGLGRSGLAAAEYTASQGAQVTVSDKKEEKFFAKEISRLKKHSVNFSFGKNDPALVTKADLIVISPGVPLNTPGLNSARKRNVPIINEMELAIREIKTPVIGISGTNGKSTTTVLLSHILNLCGIKAVCAGNIGTPLIGILKDIQKAQWVVAEISSFQLETTPSLACRIGILLNITADHLDRHASFDEYAAIKMSLFSRMKGKNSCIYNAADKTIANGVRELISNGIDARSFIPFAARDISRLNGSPYKAVYEKNGVYAVLPGMKEARFKIESGELSGLHNAENVLAASAAALICGADAHGIQKAIASFKALPHRVALVGEFDGVRFYDDSKGTNVGAVAAALENFHSPVILIAGGQDKGLSYASLARAIKKKVKLLIILGEAKEKMSSELKGSTKIILADTMKDAVNIAKTWAFAGDVVLLSPACASFDMFRDYGERGDVFRKAVEEIHG